MFAVVGQQRQFVYFAHRGMNVLLVWWYVLWLATHAASSHHARVGEGLVGNGGALPPRTPPLTSAAALRASACPQAPGGADTGRCPKYRQVPGGIGRCPERPAGAIFTVPFTKC